MNTGNSDIRLFLLSRGFIATKESGWRYLNLMYDEYLMFSCDILERKLCAEFPDVEYNKQNRFSPKNKIINFTWENKDNTELVIHNIDKFLDKIEKMDRR